MTGGAPGPKPVPTAARRHFKENAMTSPLPLRMAPLLALIASATNSELARYVEFLKEENRILRSRSPCRVHTTAEERSRLIKLGKALGRAIGEPCELHVDAHAPREVLVF